MSEMDFLDLSFLGNLGNYTAVIAQSVMWIIGLILFGAVIFFIVYITSYNKTVIVRKKINNKVQILKDKARRWKDKDGVTWWIRLKERDKALKKMPLPPPEAIDIDMKGKSFVEVYLTENGHYCYISDKAAIAEIPSDLFKNVPKEILNIDIEDHRAVALQKWQDMTLKAWKEKNNIIEAFRPFTTQQRVLTVSNVTDAEKKKKSQIWENLPQLASIAGMTIIILCLLIFAPDWFESKAQIRGVNVRIAEIQKDTVEIQAATSQNIQVIKTQQEEIVKKLDNLEKKPPN